MNRNVSLAVGRVGYRKPKHMHARGETVDQKSTWSDAFRYRRGFTWAHTFNESEEVPVLYDDGTPSKKTWTRQWTIKREDGSASALNSLQIAQAGKELSISSNS